MCGGSSLPTAQIDYLQVLSESGCLCPHERLWQRTVVDRAISPGANVNRQDSTFPGPRRGGTSPTTTSGVNVRTCSSGVGAIRNLGAAPHRSATACTGRRHHSSQIRLIVHICSQKIGVKLSWNFAESSCVTLDGC